MAIPKQVVEKAQDGAILLAAKAVAGEETKIVTLVSTAEALVIKTPEELGASTDLLQTVKVRQKELTDARLSITRPMDEAKKQVMALFQPAVDRLATAEQTIKLAVLAYTQEQRRLQAEAQAQLDAEAERERQRLATLAEKQRVAGKDERAEATEERAADVQAPVVAAAEAPSGAVHVKVTWHAEVTDLAALAKACWEGLTVADAILPNMPVLNAMARDLKGDLNIPGVKAVSEEGVAARAG
jgi:hypothetical protein